MKKSPNYWTKERVQIEALKYNIKFKFRKTSSGAYNSAIRNGWLNEVCSHMKSSGYWTKERIQIDAFKYNNRTSFIHNSSGAYNSAKANNWVDEICSHMISNKKPNSYWTIERVHIEALKYNSKIEFYKNNLAAYKATKKNNWDVYVFSHMNNNVSLCDRYIYAFEFSDNFVYIGLTCNLNKRKYEHLTKGDYNHKSGVYKHIEKTTLIPNFIILTKSSINEKIAGKTENYYINLYKKKWLEYFK